MRKVLITGPESTGKSSLAARMSEELGVPWVAEHARTYLRQLGRPYEEADLLHIAKGQVRAEEAAAQGCPPLLLCDTGMLVMKIWSEYKYGRCHPWILEQLHDRPYDLWVLCGIDTPWEADPLREHPHARQTLYGLYQAELKALGVPFIELWGSLEERAARMQAVLEGMR